MLAGEDIQGGLKSKCIIAKYEACAAASQRAFSASTQKAADDTLERIVEDLRAPSLPAEPEPRYGPPSTFVGHVLKGDATSHEAIDRKKVFLLTAATTGLRTSLEGMDVVDIPTVGDNNRPNGKYRDELLMPTTSSAEYSKVFAPLAEVVDGTGAECYRTVRHQLDSCAIKTWEARKADLVALSTTPENLRHRISRLFSFGFDGDPIARVV
jgi:hypothetical protein